jgi:hypothetical protein
MKEPDRKRTTALRKYVEQAEDPPSFVLIVHLRPVVDDLRVSPQQGMKLSQ